MRSKDTFYEIFTEALANLLLAKEFNGYLPQLIPEEKEKRIAIYVPEKTWSIFEDLGAMLQIPPTVLIKALITAAAVRIKVEMAKQKEQMVDEYAS